MPHARVLVVEDDPDIAELLQFNLTRQALHVETERDGEAALQRLRAHPPDALVLDLMLPGMDGLEVCKAVRADPNLPYIPIIMLTAKSEETDIIVGLELGADDYLAKPFSPSEFTARLKALLRRHRQQERARRLEVGPLTIDEDQHEAWIDGTPLMLTLSEFRILATLASTPGHVFARERLVKAMGHSLGDIVLDRNINVHVRSIRKKLGMHADILGTVRGIGYKLIACPPRSPRLTPLPQH